MINLLAPEDRRQLSAARTNSLLLRYTILLSIVIGVLVIEMVGTAIFLNLEKARNEAIVADNETKTASYASVKQQAEEFQGNLATAKYILGKQIPYTTLILTLANNLPSNAVLDKLTIDPATFGESSTLTVQTVSYKRAVDVKTALQDIKVNDVPLFDSVSFSSITASTDKTAKYEYTAVYQVVYAQEVLKQ